jgi:hypothetical protein
MVRDAKDRMLRVISIANTITIVSLVVFFAFISVVITTTNVRTKDGLIWILLLSIVVLNIIHLMGFWKQRAIFNVSIALLKYIELNNPDIPMPEIDDEDFMRSERENPLL